MSRAQESQLVDLLRKFLCRWTLLCRADASQNCGASLLRQHLVPYFSTGLDSDLSHIAADARGRPGYMGFLGAPDGSIRAYDPWAAKEYKINNPGKPTPCGCGK